MPGVSLDLASAQLGETVTGSQHSALGEVMRDAAQWLASEHPLDYFVDDDDLLSVLTSFQPSSVWTGI